VTTSRPRADATARAGFLRALGWLLAAVFALSLCLFCLRVSQRGRFSVPYSTHGAGPEGTLALFRLVHQLGFRPQRLSHELGRLERGTLLAIGDPCARLARPLLRPEREELARWVEAGGLLIVAGVDGFAPRAAGLSLAPAATCEQEDRWSWLGGGAQAPHAEPRASQARSDPHVPHLEPAPTRARAAGPPLNHLLPFAVRHARALRAELDSQATPLLVAEADASVPEPAGGGAALGMTTPLGRGRVVLLGTSSALTNAALADGGGAVIARLLAAFAPPGPVWFDEYHLGMGERRSLIQYLRERGFGAALLQAGLVLAILLLAYAARLSRARAPATDLCRTSGSYPLALASLYERSGDRSGALAVLGRSALRRIGRHYRAAGVEPEQLPAWLEQVGLPAVAVCARRIAAQAERPLERGESLLARAREIEADLGFAMALADA
jgi:hypothetical protein